MFNSRGNEQRGARELPLIVPPSYHEGKPFQKPLTDFFHLMGQEPEAGDQWLDQKPGPCLNQKLGPFLGTNASLPSTEENSHSMNKKRGTMTFEEVSYSVWHRKVFIYTNIYIHKYILKYMLIYVHITYTKVK